MTTQPPDPAPPAPDAAPAPGPGAPPPTARDVDYKGAPLDAAKGPGLGCFWLQIVTLGVVIVLTPLSAVWNWPVPVVIFLLASTIVLLLFVGQTIIFLLRLVAADRRSDARRRPLSSRTKTVGEIEDEPQAAEDGSQPAEGEADREGVRE